MPPPAAPVRARWAAFVHSPAAASVTRVPTAETPSSSRARAYLRGRVPIGSCHANVPCIELRSPAVELPAPFWTARRTTTEAGEWDRGTAGRHEHSTARRVGPPFTLFSTGRLLDGK